MNMSKQPSSCKKNSRDLYSKTLEITKKLTPNYINSIAKKTRFTKRNRKLSGHQFFQLMISTSINPEHTSLQDVCRNIAKLGLRGCAVSPQSLMQRINSPEATNFLSMIQHELLEKKISKICLNLKNLSTFNHFKKVLIQDSTTIDLNEKLQPYFKGSGGRASSSSAKINVTYELKEMRITNIVLTDQTKSESKLAACVDEEIDAGDLIIRDLGYANVESLTKIRNKNGYFLSRFRKDFLVYLSYDGNPINLAEFLKKRSINGVFDQEVFITSKKMKVRLVAFKTPQEIVNKRLRVAHQTAKKQRRTLTKCTKQLMGFSIFITNVSNEIWSSKLIAEIYKIRWQIELLFKQLKSTLKIEILRGVNAYRIKCLIYCRMIFAIISLHVCNIVDVLAHVFYKSEVSIHKVFIWMKDINQIRLWCRGKNEIIEKTIEKATVNLCKQKRHRKTTQASIEEIFKESALSNISGA